MAIRAPVMVARAGVTVAVVSTGMATAADATLIPATVMVAAMETVMETALDPALDPALDTVTAARAVPTPISRPLLRPVRLSNRIYAAAISVGSISTQRRGQWRLRSVAASRMAAVAFPSPHAKSMSAIVRSSMSSKSPS